MSSAHSPVPQAGPDCVAMLLGRTDTGSAVPRAVCLGLEWGPGVASRLVLMLHGAWQWQISPKMSARGDSLLAQAV